MKSGQVRSPLRLVDLHFAGDIALDGIDEDHFLAARAFVADPAPLEGAFFAEVVHGLGGAGHQFLRFRDADPTRRAVEADAELAVALGGQGMAEPGLREG